MKGLRGKDFDMVGAGGYKNDPEAHFFPPNCDQSLSLQFREINRK